MLGKQLLLILGTLAHTSLFNEHFSHLLSKVPRSLTEFLRYLFELRSLRPKVDLPDGFCQDLTESIRPTTYNTLQRDSSPRCYFSS